MVIYKMNKLLENVQNHSSYFRTRNLDEVNDDARGTCNSSSQIGFKTTMIKSSLCNYSDAYIRRNYNICKHCRGRC